MFGPTDPPKTGENAGFVLNQCAFRIENVGTCQIEQCMFCLYMNYTPSRALVYK